MSGQINMNSKAGDFIYKLACDTSNNVFVEIGTWNGQGSTECFMEGLLKRLDSSILVTLETDKKYYNISKNYWEQRTAIYKLDKIKNIFGRIVDVQEIMSIEEIEKDIKKPNHDAWRNWYNHDILCYEDVDCKNVIDSIPKEIDVLLLDGGEFSSYAEYSKLKDRCKIIALDDTNVLKNFKVNEELKESSEWETLVDYSAERNGFCAYIRK